MTLSCNVSDDLGKQIQSLAKNNKRTVSQILQMLVSESANDRDLLKRLKIG